MEGMKGIPILLFFPAEGNSLQKHCGEKQKWVYWVLKCPCSCWCYLHNCERAEKSSTRELQLRGEIKHISMRLLSFVPTALPRLQGAAELSYLKGHRSSVCSQGPATVPLRQGQDLSKQCCSTSEKVQLCAAAERQPTQIYTCWGCSRDLAWCIRSGHRRQTGLLLTEWGLAGSWGLSLWLLLRPRCETPCRTVTFLSWKHYQNALVNQVPRETLCLLCSCFSLKLSGKMIGEYI